MDKFDKYKEIVDEWLSISKRQDKIREKRFILGDDIIEYSKEINKTPLEYEPIDLYTLIYKRIKVKTLSEYNSFKNGLSQLYEYAISIGEINRNITNDPLFSTSVARNNIGNMSDYLSEQDVSAIVSKIKRNRIYFLALFMSLYENVGRTCREISRIKSSDIDFDNATIKRDNGKIIGISKRLIGLYTDLLEVDSYESRSGQQFAMVREYGLLFPRLAYADSKEYNEDLYSEKLAVNLSAEIRRVSDEIGVEMSARIIYESGMFHNVSNYVGGDDVMIDAMTANDRKKNKLLKDALTHYGYTITLQSFKYAHKGVVARK